MKALKIIKHSAIAATLFVLGFAMPVNAFAGTNLIQSTGVNDESLFLILTLVAILQLVAILVIAGVIKSIASNRAIWQSMGMKGKTLTITSLLVIAGFAAQAQNADFDALVNMDDTGFIALIAVNFMLLLTFIYLTGKLNSIMNMMLKEGYAQPRQSAWQKLMTVFTGKTVPIEQEHELELDHEYDGIRELDNNLPPWWLWSFYASIVFAVIYLFYYHVSGTGQLQAEEYEVAMEQAEQAKEAFMATNENAVDESNVTYLSDAPSLEAGKKIFVLYCAPCHGENGGSSPNGVGPNLTDDYWIHGGSMNDIYRTIKVGVPEKGMVSWEAQLSPQKIQEVSSFIKSLHGSNPENPKPPQGEIWVEMADSE